MRTGIAVGGRFELLRLTATGGMGEVYQAKDLVSGETVAVKVLLEAGTTSDERRFERESQVLAELSHPGIVRYIAHGRTPSGEPYLAMEWLEGEGLNVRLA